MHSSPYREKKITSNSKTKDYHKSKTSTENIPKSCLLTHDKELSSINESSNSESSKSSKSNPKKQSDHVIEESKRLNALIKQNSDIS